MRKPRKSDSVKQANRPQVLVLRERRRKQALLLDHALAKLREPIVWPRD
ncbi:hypothetical protein AMST5_04090 [freshwater sediment metagenome]|uniref:Uncharacterized protein n=1 Tax=freshwater sediment metagenome TaxID=556182 RepID=A0AA48M4B2_9ZZZZ